MRRMRYFLIPWLIATCLIPVIAEGPARTSPPPRAINRRNAAIRAWTVKGPLYTHGDATRVAASDLAGIIDARMKSRTFSTPLEQQAYLHELRKELCYYRWLSIHNIPADYRELYYKLASFLMNSLAGLGLSIPATTIVRPAWGGPDNIMIRVNLFDYGINPKTFDRLAVTEPYFHADIDQTDVITHRDGTVETTLVSRRRGAGAAADPMAISFLMENTQSVSPIVRFDWFLRNAVLEPNYRNLMGIKTIDDFKRLVVYDRRLEALKQIKATVVNSGSDGLCARVAINNRLLARTPTGLGYWWETFDFKTSIGKQNVINKFINFLNNKEAEKLRDAAEFIASMPNGLQAYAITNEKNQLLDAGNTDIVVDTIAHDVTVRNARSCIWCHAAGINPFKSNFQLQIGARRDQSDLGVFAKDPLQALDLTLQIRDVFGLADWDNIVKADNESIFARAIAACNDLDPITNGTAFKTAWDRYDVSLIEKDDLVFETGLSPQDVQFILGLRLNGVSNGVLIQGLLEPGVGIRRDQFEEAFNELALLISVVRPNAPPVVPVRSKPPRVPR